jgi:hypothetical protein
VPVNRGQQAETRKLPLKHGRAPMSEDDEEPEEEEEEEEEEDLGDEEQKE